MAVGWYNTSIVIRVSIGTFKIMIHEPIEVIDYKGLKIEIDTDEDCGYIRDDFDSDDEVFLVGYHSDFWVERKDFISKDDAVALFTKEYDDDYQRDRCKDILKKYWVFGLEAYIHSGAVLALSREGSFCDRRWDVSQLGLVFVSKKEARLNSTARKRALNLIERWNSYLSGEVYGYTIKDKDGDDLDSCSGYLGDIKHCIEEAKRSAESCYKDILKKRQERVKTYIKHKVPLDKRVSFSM